MRKSLSKLLLRPESTLSQVRGSFSSFYAPSCSNDRPI
jgi:hypothetical protein